jgi:hypothetical protein
MVDITIVNGVYKPTYNCGAPHCINGTSRLNTHFLNWGELTNVLSSMDCFKGKSKPETIDFPIKYGAFLKMFP